MSIRYLLRTYRNPGVDDIDEGVQVYRKFYSKKDEQKFGVIGIHLRVLTKMK
jgi:ASC-1-like (ASCH) protein